MAPIAKKCCQGTNKQANGQRHREGGEGWQERATGHTHSWTPWHISLSLLPRSLLYIFVTSVDNFFSHYKALRILNLLGQRSKSLRKSPPGKSHLSENLSACKRCKRERTKDQLKLSLTNDMEIIWQMGKFTKCENARKFSINFV